MRLSILALVTCGLLSAAQSSAEQSDRTMLPDVLQSRWDAVGRLNVMGQGYCSATLVEPNLVLTAAHCVANRRAGGVVAPGAVHFLAGFRSGDFAAHGRAAEIIPASGYFEGGRPAALDFAFVRLREPVPSASVRPLPMADRVDVGLEVSSYSYGRDRSFIMSQQAGCNILGRRATLLRTDCEATFGVSGAPLIVQTEDGPRVAAVVVAMVDVKRPQMRGKALAVSIEAARFAALPRTAVTGPTKRPARAANNPAPARISGP